MCHVVRRCTNRPLSDQFDHVVVDEYQDTNRDQSAILLAMRPSGEGLTVVGDDSQSIYSFRAATVRNTSDFPASFSPNAENVTLDRNYRSTQPIPTDWLSARVSRQWRNITWGFLHFHLI